VCGDTLFSLARQGREFLPGKFTDIDWMTPQVATKFLIGQGFEVLSK
jgi:hypothetical protein